MRARHGGAFVKKLLGICNRTFIEGLNSYQPFKEGPEHGVSLDRNLKAQSYTAVEIKSLWKDG
jgi:hypothetical protein